MDGGRRICQICGVGAATEQPESGTDATHRKGWRRIKSMQLFQIIRAPEAEPISPERIQRLLEIDRTDTEWTVREVELESAKIVGKFPQGKEGAK